VPVRIGVARQWIAISLIIAALAGGASALGAPAPADARPLSLGFADQVFEADAPERGIWLDRAAETGAETVGLSAEWRDIAPSPPADGTNPADPNYEFSSLDASVRDASARGLRVLISINRAPDWAEGAGRDSSAPSGTWKPDPAALAEFAGALATRYSGSFDPDGPLGQPPLPAVRDWQVWGEPNLYTNLNPQWVEKKGEQRPFAPGHYREMLNRAYDAIKAVDGSNLVVSAGTGPYGDPFKGGRRIAPALFWREVLCLDGGLDRSCGKKTKLDVLAHDPYSVGGPFRKARNDDDVSVPDMGKLKRILRAAQRQRTAEPRGGQQLWVTEISWDSNPPDPSGVPERKQANHLADAFYLLSKTGVEQILWFQIRDQAPEPSFGSTYQSGVFFRDGTPKLAAQAFHFPFTAQTVKGRNRVEVWGRAPVAGEVTIEREGDSGFEPAARFRTGASNVFHGTLKATKRQTLRATVGGESSLARQPR
jgi:hypothetical protein